MITHDDPAERYIKQILINNDYHGECYLNDSVSKCDFIDCSLYHDRILTVSDKMKIDLFYGNTTSDYGYCRCAEHGYCSACASISLQPVGTGKSFVI